MVPAAQQASTAGEMLKLLLSGTANLNSQQKTGEPQRRYYQCHGDPPAARGHKVQDDSESRCGTALSSAWMPPSGITAQCQFSADFNLTQTSSCGGSCSAAHLTLAAPGPNLSPSQLPRLATGRAAVTNDYSHRMFC